MSASRIYFSGLKQNMRTKLNVYKCCRNSVFCPNNAEGAVQSR